MKGNKRIQDELLVLIHEAAHAHYGEKLPSDVKKRMETEIGHIFKNGYAPILALVVRIAELSEELGYPIGFRGYFCDLFLAYLLGLVPENPLEHCLPWEAVLGLSGERVPVIDINLSDEVIGRAEKYIKETSSQDENICEKVMLHHYVVFDDIGRWSKFTGLPYHRIDVTSDKLFEAAGGRDSNGIAEFDNALFRDLAQKLKPKTLEELAGIIGMCHGTNVWAPVQSSYYESSDDKERLRTELIGSAEDVFDLCMRYGIEKGDAFHITEKIRRGKADMMTDAEAELLDRKEVPQMLRDTLMQIGYLFSKGQCLNYAHWNLVLLQYRISNPYLFNAMSTKS